MPANKMQAVRHNMVAQQVLTNVVLDDTILNALEQVPREQFVPENYQQIAYIDDGVPLGVDSNGVMRYLLEPMVFAKLLDKLNLQPNQKILEVGCASGYTTAVLSHLAHYVYALESDEILAGHASNNLQKLGISNVHISIGALQAGHAVDAPYDAIIVSGAMTHVPPVFGEQLKEGGRIVYIERSIDAPIGRLALGFKHEGVIVTQPFDDLAADFLPGLVQNTAFEF